MSVLAVEFDLSAHTSKEIPLDDFLMDLSDKNKIYWIHGDLRDEIQFQEIAEKLSFSNELITVCLNEETTKQIIDSDNTLIIQVLDLVENSDRNNEIKFGNLFIYLTERFCFTATRDPVQAVLKFQQEYMKNIRYALTSGFILFLILDNVINDYSTVFQEYESISDKMDNAIREKHKGTYREIVKIKNQIVKIKRNVLSLRDILMRISSRRISVISEPCRLSLSDSFNHVQMIVHEADSIRDILNSILDFIDNSLMQRINKSIGLIKTLATLFLPLLAIAGLYHMNLQWIAGYQWKNGYFFVLFFMLLMIVGLSFLVKKRK